MGILLGHDEQAAAGGGGPHRFTDFTPQEERVLSALMAQGELTAALVCDPGDDPAGIFQPALRAAKRLAAAARAEVTRASTGFSRMSSMAERNTGTPYRENTLSMSSP